MLVAQKRKIISVLEASERLGVSDQTIRRYLEEGRLEGYRLTPGLKRSPWRVYEDSVIAFEEKRRGDTKPLN